MKDRVYPLGKVWLPTSQRYLQDYIKLLQQIEKKPYKVLDLGCGCGILSFLFAKFHKNSQIKALDKNQDAVNTTNVNASRLKFEHIEAFPFDITEQKSFKLKTMEY